METVVVTRPMQWAATPDISDVPPLSQADWDCIREVRDVLEKFDRLGRFGLSLIHKHFDLGDDEVLVETIDKEKRALTVVPVKKSAMPDSIETQWQLSKGEALVVCHGYCTYDSGHRRWHEQR